VVEAPVERRPDEDDDGEVIDLMEVLKRSLRPPEPGPRRSEGQRLAAPERNRRRGPRGHQDLRAMTRAQLYERAQELGIPGRSGMTKEQLIRALRKSA
jgi:DNA end-binding protein Ku